MNELRRSGARCGSARRFRLGFGRRRLVAAIVIALLLSGGLGPGAASQRPHQPSVPAGLPLGLGPRPPGLSLADLGFGPAPVHARTAPRPPRYPVLLVHGLGGDPSAWDKSPLPQLLQQAGYVPGRTLFFVDYGTANYGDYVEIYRDFLMPAIDRAKAASGANQVDLVAFSMGGLVSRYYVQSSDYRGDVRTLVLLASPTRGSFAASLVRGWYESDIQYHWSDAYRDQPEHVYVRNRLPAYADLVARFQVVSRERLFNRTEALLDWTRWAEPEFFETAVLGQQHPVFELAKANGVPAPAAGLTGSFYELLTAQTAIALSERPVLQTWAPFLSRDVAMLADLLIDEADLLGFALALMNGFGLDAGSEAINRMIEEFSPAGSRARVLTNAFLYDWNERLAATRRQTERQPDTPIRGVRQVIVAGSMLNVWAPFRSGTGPNDGVVAVASTVLPPERDDRFRLFSGVAMHHLHVKNNGAVAAYVLKALADEFQPATAWAPAPPGWLQRLFRKGGPVTHSATLAAGYWEPAYFDVQRPADGASGSLHVTVSLTDKAARTGSVAVWAYVERQDGTWETRDLLYPGSLDQQASLRLPGFGADAVRVLIGVRRQLPSAGLASLAVDGAQALPVTVHASYDADGTTVTPPAATPIVTPAPAPPPPLLGAGGPLPPEPGDAPASAPGPAERAHGPVHSDPNPDGSPAPDTPDAPAPPAPDAPAPGRPDIPVITVERTNRLTTNWQEDITEHANWTWDFGDGTTSFDPDPARVRSTVQHTYAQPGQYTVTATATSNKGETIRRQTFAVTVAEPGETHTFTAESIHPPQVAFTLSGPKGWLVGNTAPFTATADITAPPFGEITAIRYDPGEEFAVLWLRPNHFQVIAAVRVDVTYRWPEGGTFKLRNTYVRRQHVEVMATGLSR